MPAWRPQRLLTALAVALLVVVNEQQRCVVEAVDHGPYSPTDFYRMVEDVTKRVDYYKALEVDEAADAGEIRKAFKRASLKWHPDKNAEPEAPARFELIVFAYDVLFDAGKRQLYDSYRRDGVPWVENYYGKYAHRYGAPDHDIRWVLFWLITVVTVAHYLYRWHRYTHIVSQIKHTDRYKHSKLRLSNGASKTKRKGGKGKRTEEEEVDDGGPEPEIKLMGVSKPGLKDLIVVRLIKLPFYLLYLVFCLLRFIFWYKMLGKKPPPINRRKIIQEKLGLSDEEYKEYKRKWKEKQRLALRFRRR